MAKKTVAKAKTTTKANVPAPRKAATAALVLGEEPQLPAGYKNKGVGASQRPEDQQIPFIGILQTLSPQLKKTKPEYIEGAEEGMFFFKNCEPPIRDGNEGFYFIPSFFQTAEYVEWVPRDAGGGLVGRHAKLPDDVKVIKDAKNPNKMKFVGKNGNEFIETRYVYGQALDNDLNLIGSFVISFTSTGHSVWKTWNQRANNKRIGDQPADVWLYVYKLTTAHRENAAGDWYVFNVEDAGWNTSDELILAGEALYNSVMSGEKVAMAEDRMAADDSGSM